MAVKARYLRSIDIWLRSPRTCFQFTQPRQLRRFSRSTMAKFSAARKLPPNRRPRLHSGRGGAPTPSTKPGRPRRGLWAQVEKIIRADKNIETAAVGRIGVEDLARRIPVEGAGAGAFVAREFADLVIIQRFAGGFLLGRRRHVIVEVEVAAERRHPFEAPAHAPLECLDLRRAARATRRRRRRRVARDE